MKPWLSILLTVVLAGVVVGGGVYAYQSQNAKKEKDELQSKVTELETQKKTLQKELNDLNSEVSATTEDAGTAPTASTDPTADWKTFAESTAGYTIKYPSDYKTSVIKSNDTTGFAPSNSTNKQGPDPFVIRYFKPVPSATLDAYVNNNVTNEKVIKDCNKTTLNGKAAYECVDMGIVNFYSLISLNNGNIFWITLTAGSGDGESTAALKDSLTSIQKNMLSSFKFTK